MLRQVGAVASVVLVGVLGAVVGLLVAGTVRAPVGPFDADLHLQPGPARTVVGVPPLGQLQFDTHDAPVQLTVALAALREDAARAIVTDPEQLLTLGSDVQSDVRDALVELFARTVVVTVVGAAGLAFLVFRRQWRRVGASAVAGLGTLVLAGGVSAATLDRQALAEPRFTGLLASAPAAIGDVRDLVERFDEYELQLGRLVANVSELYQVTSELPGFVAHDDTIRVLHVSDLHLNPAAFDVIAAAVRQFGIDVVVDTGDITDWGTAAEARYVEGIAALDVPYVYVRGNHDSALIQEAVAAQPNAVVLDGEVVDVAGLRILGAGDPRFTPNKTNGDDEAPEEEIRDVGQALARTANAAFDLPDIVAVHDPLSAEPLLGTAPVVLAGHKHQREVVEEEGSLLLIQGSTGGAGLRALEGEKPTPVEMSVLYFDEETGELQAYDEITLGGLGTSDVRIRRQVVEAPEPGEEAAEEAAADNAEDGAAEPGEESAQEPAEEPAGNDAPAERAAQPQR